MNKKKEIMELKAEVRRLKEATTYFTIDALSGDTLLVPVKDVINMILKDLCLELHRCPGYVELKTTYDE